MFENTNKDFNPIMFQFITIASKSRANTALAATVTMDTSASVTGSTLGRTAKVSEC